MGREGILVNDDISPWKLTHQLLFHLITDAMGAIQRQMPIQLDVHLNDFLPSGLARAQAVNTLHVGVFQNQLFDMTLNVFRQLAIFRVRGAAIVCG